MSQRLALEEMSPRDDSTPDGETGMWEARLEVSRARGTEDLR